MRELSQRSANLQLHLGPHKNEGIAEPSDWRRAGRQCCGSRLAEKNSNNRGIFWPRPCETACFLASEGKRADLIIGNNVLAQVPDLNDFVGGMAILLNPDGVITLEFPHLEHLIDMNQFDTIYHEHFSYFSIVTIDRLAKQHALRVFDVEHLTTHGGSLRVYLCHADAPYVPSSAVADLLAHERRVGFEDIVAYASFSAKVHHTKRQLLNSCRS